MEFLWILLLGLFVLLGFVIALPFSLIAVKRKNRQERAVERIKRKQRLEDDSVNLIKDYSNGFPDDYVVLKFNTTGSDYLNDDIFEVGALKIINHKPVFQFSQLVKPRKALSLECMTLYEINKYTFEKKPYIERVVPELIEFIGDLPIVGYDVEKDVCFLIANSGWEGLNSVYDIRDIVENMYPEMGQYKLKYITKHFNVDRIREERALQYCLIVGKCFEKIRKDIINNSTDEVCKN